MRPLRALGIYIAAVFLGGALLAPWIYWLVQAGAPTFPSLSHEPFHRFVSRSMQVVAFAGLWPLFRGLGARTAADLGLCWPKGHWKKLLAGFLVGFISLAIVALLTLLLGACVLDDRLTPGKAIQKFSSAALSAFTVAVLEEILFRGGIFGGLRRAFNWRFALGASSMIYAIVHFFARTKDSSTVTWLSGLSQLGLMLRGFTDWQQIIPGFFNLTLAGILLAQAYQRTGNLYFSIGLHAGWIFWLKSYGVLTEPVPQANHWLWGSTKMIDGWLACVVLSLTVVVFVQIWPRRCRHQPL